MENFNDNNENYSTDNSFNDVIFNETPQFFEQPDNSEKFSEEPKRNVYEEPVRNTYEQPNKNVYKEPVSNNKQNSKIGLTLLCIVLSVVVGAVSGFVSASYFNKNNSNQPSGENSSGTNNIVNITVDETVNSSIEAVAAKVRPSVVGIRTTAAIQSFFFGSQESTGEGSGIVYTTDGYIITNYHVIESAVLTANSSIEVFFESDVNTGYPATVVGYNISHDLAVIKIDKTDLTKIEIADTSNLTVGQYCVAVGAPGGLEYIGSVTNGVISGLNRTMSSSTEDGMQLIQTNTAINPGNSGGALVNMQGELIGVNSSKIVSESFEGMGFAIPANTAIDICDKIIAKEYDPDPYVGITFSESWTPERLQKYGYPVGAVVSSVVDGGPAFEGGIRSGDIIVKFANSDISNYEQFNDKLSKCKAGESVVVEFYRSGKYYSTAVVVGSNNSQ